MSLGLFSQPTCFSTVTLKGGYNRRPYCRDFHVQDSGTPWYQDVRTWIAAASATCLTIFGVLKEDGDSSVWGVFLGLAILLLVVELVLIARVNGMLCFRAEVASAGNEPAGEAHV